jgi:hypothetical protein
MRTALTLAPDVIRLLNWAAHRLRKSCKELVNEALRRGLASRSRRPGSKRHWVRPHKAKLRPGLDRGRPNSLADASEDLAILAKQ